MLRFLPAIILIDKGRYIFIVDKTGLRSKKLYLRNREINLLDGDFNQYSLVM